MPFKDREVYNAYMREYRRKHKPKSKPKDKPENDFQHIAEKDADASLNDSVNFVNKIYRRHSENKGDKKQVKYGNQGAEHGETSRVIETTSVSANSEKLRLIYWLLYGHVSRTSNRDLLIDIISKCQELLE